MGGLARAGVAALLLAAAMAWAQEVDVPVSEVARCLTVREGGAEAPTYPFDEFKLRQRGAVQVRLSFGSPDAPPELTVQEHHGGEAFVKAVRAHATELRAPCLQPGAGPVQLIRDYVFRPDDRRVHAFRAEDARSGGHRRALKCVAHVNGERSPEYPPAARRVGLQGRVIATLSFHAPDQPPQVQVHARSSARVLARSVEFWAQGLRMPCHPGGVVQGDWELVFRMEGSGAYGFRDVSLRSLLATTVGIERQTLQFDTRQMGCPFDVKLQYRQPQLRNRVGEVGQPDPARRPLLEWLETVQLNLSDLALDSVFGDSTVITIPCVNIDLKPKE